MSGKEGVSFKVVLVEEERFSSTLDQGLKLLADAMGKAREKGLKLACRVADDVPDTLVGDRMRLRQVLVNLLGNAVKYSLKSPVTRVEVGAAIGDNEITYFVRDNGAGFDMRHATKLFGVFQRMHTQAEFPGTGVGLATVQRIVQRHGGSVWAESAPGRGAAFFFTLRE